MGERMLRFWEGRTEGEFLPCEFTLDRGASRYQTESARIHELLAQGDFGAFQRTGRIADFLVDFYNPDLKLAILLTLRLGNNMNPLRRLGARGIHVLEVSTKLLAQPAGPADLFRALHNILVWIRNYGNRPALQTPGWPENVQVLRLARPTSTIFPHG